MLRIKGEEEKGGKEGKERKTIDRKGRNKENKVNGTKRIESNGKWNKCR